MVEIRLDLKTDACFQEEQPANRLVRRCTLSFEISFSLILFISLPWLSYPFLKLSKSDLQIATSRMKSPGSYDLPLSCPVG